MVLPRGNWQPLKIYEGAQIYIDPGTGQFGAHLGKSNGSWMARKDLKVIEREIRKRRGGIPVVMVNDKHASKQELTAREKDRWITADGTVWNGYHVWVYPFDAELLTTLEALVARRKDLQRQERVIDQEWSDALRQHKSIHESQLPQLLAEHRAQQAQPEETEEG